MLARADGDAGGDDQDAEDELAAADPATTSVSAVATDWGFTHLGRFSVAFRRRFGCSPSDVLRG